MSDAKRQLWFPYPVSGVGVTEALEQHSRRAAWIGYQANDGSLCSFRSMLVAFLLGEDEISRWFQAYVSERGARAPLLRSVQLDEKDGLEGIARRAASLDPELRDSDTVAWTISAKALFERAVADMRERGDSELDTIHVMAAYASDDGQFDAEHDQQLASWRLERSALSKAFSEFRRRRSRAAGLDDALRELGEGMTAEHWRAEYRFSQRARSILDRALVSNERTRELGVIDSEELFFAVVNVGREDGRSKVTSSPRFLHDRIHATPAGGEAYLSLRLKRPKALGSEPSSFARVAKDLAGLVAKARQIALDTNGDERIHSRHLVGAMLAFSLPDGPTPAQRCVTVCGLLFPEILDAFLEYVVARHDDDDHEAWRAVLVSGRRPLRHLPGFSPDDVAREDRLGMAGEIEAFAALVAARDLRPPLSIGLFGDWGTGKSFFMEHMRGQVERLAASAEESGEAEPPYCTRIAQITFNAWHYAEANLWPSLVAHIFTRLRSYLEGEKNESAQAVEELFGALATAEKLRDEAEEARVRAEGECRDAKSILDRVTDEHAKESSSLAKALATDIWKGLDPKNAAEPEVKAAVEAASKLFGPGVVGSARQLKQTIDGVKTGADRLRTVLGYVAREPRAAGYVAAIAAAMVVVGTLFHYFANELRPAVEILTEVLVFLGGVAKWLSARLSEAHEQCDSLRPLDEWLEKRARAAESEHARAVEEARAKADAAKAKVTEAAARVAVAEQRVKDAERAVQEQQPDRQLVRFIQERVASREYDQHLGVIAAIRRDFERMTELLTQSRAAGGSPGAPGKKQPFVERIVLYVDDLDRCPPQRVVDVLQAIHLLLAFRLFVVVVGVDARWVSQALLDQYPHLAGGNGARSGDSGATAHDYLEKIFQLPYWLPPMDEAGCRNLLDGLVAEGGAPKKAVAPVGPPVAPPSVHPVDGKEADGDGVAGGTEPGLAARNTAGRTPDLPEVAPPPPAAAAIDHARLTIDAHESACMHELSEFIARSPRRAKRFLNVYRVLKASLPPKDYADLVRARGTSGDHKAILALLSIVTGAPLASDRVFATLAASDDALTVTDLIARLKGGVEGDLPRAIGALRRYVTLSGSEKATVAPLRKWRALTARYSFGFQPDAPLPPVSVGVPVNGTITVATP